MIFFMQTILTVLHGEVFDVVALIKDNTEEDEKERYTKTIGKVSREVETFFVEMF